MSLDVVIGVIGVLVTIFVVVGMVLITPRGAETSGVQDAQRPASVNEPALR